MARHKAFSKQRWSAALKCELDLLTHIQHQGADLKPLISSVKKRYISLLHAHIPQLYEGSKILELGCGPTCISQFISIGKKTFLDPLLDNFRRTWPGSLPKGTFIAGMAENIEAPDASYELILCLRTMSHVQNPELVLHEAERLLKPHGRFIISVELWPTFFAKLHYVAAMFFPQRSLKNRLYCYTQQGIETTLQRHFNIHFKQRLPSQQAFSLKKEIFYVCTPLDHS